MVLTLIIYQDGSSNFQKVLSSPNFSPIFVNFLNVISYHDIEGCDS